MLLRRSSRILSDQAECSRRILRHPPPLARRRYFHVDGLSRFIGAKEHRIFPSQSPRLVKPPLVTVLS